MSFVRNFLGEEKSMGSYLATAAADFIFGQTKPEYDSTMRQQIVALQMRYNRAFEEVNHRRGNPFPMPLEFLIEGNCPRIVPQDTYTASGIRYGSNELFHVATTL